VGTLKSAKSGHFEIGVNKNCSKDAICQIKHVPLLRIQAPHLQLKVQSSEKPLKQYPYNDEVSGMKRGLQAFITKYHPAYAIKFTGNKFGCDNQRRFRPLVMT
jgi:hypothetical protein